MDPTGEAMKKQLLIFILLTGTMVFAGAVRAQALGRQSGWLRSPYARGAYKGWEQMELVGQGAPLALMPGVVVSR